MAGTRMTCDCQGNRRANSRTTGRVCLDFGTTNGSAAVT